MKISPLNFILFAFILLCTLPRLTAQNIHFPDPNFKQALLDAGVDTGNDGEISQAEAEGVTQLIVSRKNISDLTGIGYFTNLTLLYCSSNSLTHLDLDELTNLRILSCDNNFLSTLDLAALTNLESLSCSNNNLTVLDVDPLPNLVQLHCDGNNLTNLDLDALTKLTHLNCDDNFLMNLNLENLINLVSLSCSSNSLSSLDVSSLTSLEIFYCDNNALTSLDVSSLTSLVDLYCYNNSLTSLNVAGLTSLFQLNCSNNSLTSLDVSGLINLRNLNCSINSLTSLDVSGLSYLITILCSINSLNNLDISGATNLVELRCHTNNLSSIDISGLIRLERLYCHQNNLTSLDVSGLTSLKFISCDNNSLTSLDVSGLTNLLDISFDNNSLTSFDASGLSSLRTLSCDKNDLTNLVVSGLNSLGQLSCNYNDLTVLDIRKTSIFNLEAEGNPDLECIIVDDIHHLPTFLSIDQDVAVFNTEPCGKDFDSFDDVSVLLEDVDLSTYTQAVLLAKLKVAEASCTTGKKWMAVTTLITLDAMVNRLQQLGRLSESQAAQLRDAFDTMQNKIVSGELDCSNGTAPNITILDWITSWYSLESAGNEDSDEWPPTTVYPGSPEKVINSAPRIYPNPTAGRVSFSQTINKIEVYNLKGQLMMKTFETDHLDLHSYQAGVYVIRLIDDKGESSMHRLVKR